VGVSQTFRRATYIRQGGHHVGYIIHLFMTLNSL